MLKTVLGRIDKANKEITQCYSWLMGRGKSIVETRFSSVLGQRRGSSTPSRHSQAVEGAEKLALLTQEQRDYLKTGYSSHFTWTAVLAPEPQTLSHDQLPAIYLTSDLSNAEPCFVTADGRSGASDEMPEGERFIVSPDVLAPPQWHRG